MSETSKQKKRRKESEFWQGIHKHFGNLEKVKDEAEEFRQANRKIEKKKRQQFRHMTDQDK